MTWHPRRIVAPLIAIALTASGLPAQQIIPFVGGGVALGTGDIGSDTDVGWLVTAGADVPVPALATGLGVGVAASYASIPYSGGFSEKMEITSVTLELSYAFLDPASLVRPYLRAGGGLQVQRYDPGSIDASPLTESRPAFAAGAGVNIELGSIGAQVGGRFSSSSDGGFLGFHGGIVVPLDTGR